MTRKAQHRRPDGRSCSCSLATTPPFGVTADPAGRAPFICHEPAMALVLPHQLVADTSKGHRTCLPPELNSGSVPVARLRD